MGKKAVIFDLDGVLATTDEYHIDLSAKPFYLGREDKAWVRATLSGMSRQEKIGQIFCLILRSEEDWRNKLDEALRILPGGLMFRPLSKEVAREAAVYAQDKSAIPLLMAANLERGGSGLIKEGTNYACNMEVAATGDPRYAVMQAKVCAREGKAVGGNWAFAPVIDIDRNFRNPITNTRTYGADPGTVAKMGKAYVKTIQAQGLAASIKHFPGDGVDERDQHLTVSVNDLSCEEWNSTYGSIYRACIDEGALSVMVGHIALPEYSRRLSPGIRDRDILPASLSEELIQGLLRRELGFNGLVVTDATTMVGITQNMPRSQAVPRTIAAGCDMFLFTRNLNEDYAYMVEGVESGVISPARLDEAVTRVLAMKAALGLHRKKASGELVPSKAALSEIGSKEHIFLARDCADKAITLVKSDGTLPIRSSKGRRILLHILGDAEAYGNIRGGRSLYFQKKLETEGFSVAVFDPSSGQEGGMKPYAETADNYDYIFYFCALATKSNQTTVRIEWAQPMGANCPIYISSVPTVFISMENPYHLLDVPRVRTYINAYTNTEEVIDALVEKLMGRSEFIGTSPVDPFCGRWDTRL